MTELNELAKFQILTDIKENIVDYANLTIPEIQEKIKQNFEQFISTRTLYNWSKIYGFSYKQKRKVKKVTLPGNEIEQINQRIRILGIVIRNLCIELDIKHPTILDKLIEGIEKQYQASVKFNFANELEKKQLEKSIYDEL